MSAQPRLGDSITDGDERIWLSGAVLGIFHCEGFATQAHVTGRGRLGDDVGINEPPRTIGLVQMDSLVGA